MSEREAVGKYWKLHDVYLSQGVQVPGGCAVQELKHGLKLNNSSLSNAPPHESHVTEIWPDIFGLECHQEDVDFGLAHGPMLRKSGLPGFPLTEVGVFGSEHGPML